MQISATEVVPASLDFVSVLFAVLVGLYGFDWMDGVPLGTIKIKLISDHNFCLNLLNNFTGTCLIILPELA